MSSVKLVMISCVLTTFSGPSMQSDTTFVADGNPVMKYKYAADPGTMMHNGEVYIYAGHDECSPPKEHYQLNEQRVLSSPDMKTWTEHPVPLRAKDFGWTKGEAWASQVIERDGRFYWYVTVECGVIHEKSVGIAVPDSSAGSFVGARGSALITNDMTTRLAEISWEDIDPTVSIDDDGQTYLYWGNIRCYYVKLKKNMIELNGPTVPVHLPRYTEAPWVYKRGDWYHLSHASEFPEKICRAMNRSITGPWKYKGILNEIAGNSNTNHQVITEFKDNWYFTYHDGSISTTGGSFRRSVYIDRPYYNEDGTMKRIQMTTEGVQ